MWTRTPRPADYKNQLLYQLSYAGAILTGHTLYHERGQ